MTSFAELQAAHQALLDRLPKGKPPEEYLGAVLAHIAQATAAAANIPASRDRDQLRANLRFWASYVFDHTGAYPDTTLRPSVLADTGAVPAPPVPPRPLRPLLSAALGVSLCLAAAICAVVFIFREPLLTAFEPTPTQTAVVGATAPTPTPAPGVTRTALPPVETALPPPTRTQAPIAVTPSPTPPLALRTLMLADVAHAPGQDCAARTVQVSVDPAGRVPPEEVLGALAELRFAGSHEPDAAAAISPNGASLSVESFTGGEEPETYLLSVVHPALTFSSLILQFEPGCANNQVQVRYAATEAPSLLPSQPPPGANLDLGWSLIAWGPAPQDEDAWVAQLELFARGGDGSYIFWDGSSFTTQEPDLLLTQRACAAAHRAVGVSSGGISLLREIILQAPFCPHAPG